MLYTMTNETCYGHIFKWNSPFNQDLSSWDVSNVTYMGDMFRGTEFNQDIGNWNVSKVTNMTQMWRYPI